MNYSPEQLARATKAIHRVTGGAITFGKPKRGKRAATQTTVSAEVVAAAALDAATRVEVRDPLEVARG